MAVFYYTPDKNLITVDPLEVLRYMGVCGSSDENTFAMAQNAVSVVSNHADPRACYGVCDITVHDDVTDFGFTAMQSQNLARILGGCKKAVIFGATLGSDIDRIITFLGKTSPAKALGADAAASAFIESFCDKLSSHIAACDFAEGKGLSPRFSPGYGGLSLEHQKEIFAFLDLPRRIGLTLTDSCMMTPSKSVTAIVGIGGKCKPAKCELCDKKDCDYRKV
ncbi:MAG: vitamin B12 dependent-methionine synthase activation domain-containing protein [Bacillota bacterium]|nr:vitamin B12 dependent-methionine synthase activation domain-containing protein [Bacillota bacterium]